MLVHIKDIVKDAQDFGYAIGAFNVHNLEIVLGVARAANRAASPAIIQVSEGAIKYLGLKPVTHIVSTVAKNIATFMPVALHLDHGSSLNSVFGCIEAGFTSVHIDASNLPLDENIKLTKQVVDIAHKKGVWVQGEVGAMIGGHGNLGGRLKSIPVANPDEVIKFVEMTGVDTIAAGIGTAHGVYENEDIRFDLLKKIKNIVSIPFVLHGASGISDEKIKKGIREGVNIINIGSDIKIAFCQTLVNECSDHQTETDPRNLLSPTITAVEEVVYKKMLLFGSAGRIETDGVET